MKLSIIIVLHNEFDLVMDCLDSIFKDAVEQMEVILVDNSDKIGVKKVLEKFPTVFYIKSSKNLGYGKGATLGLNRAKGKYLLVLTPDTILIKGTIAKTVFYMDKHTDVACVGCRIYSPPLIFNQSVFRNFPNILTHIYEYNVIFYKLCKFFSSSYHPTFFKKEEHEKELVVKHMIGAYMLLRRNVIKKVGFFDEDYFMYREETDLCKRLWDAGWKIVYLPIGGLIHKENHHKKIKITQASHSYQTSTYLFFIKHYGHLYAFFAWILTVISAIASLFYLFSAVIVRRLLKHEGQSKTLLPYWRDILFWHITSGFSMIFLYNFKFWKRKNKISSAF